MFSIRKTISMSAVCAVILTLTTVSFAKEYVVGFQEGHFKKSVPNMQLLSANSAKPMRVLKNLKMMIVDINSKEDLIKLQADQGVKFIESTGNFKAPAKIHSSSMQTASFTKGLVEYPWGVLEVDAPAAWPLSQAGEGVKVLVLDTGIDKNHPNIASRFVEGRNFIKGDPPGTDVPYPYFDQGGHGTHVAGTILADGSGAGVVGVAPSASLYVGRVCSVQFCEGAAIIEGVEWAIEEKMHVVNMSLGGAAGTDAIAQIYKMAEEANVVIVAASGNDGANRISYPSKYPAVLSVGAIDENLNVADFSNYDADLDVVAPGVDVFSSLPLGTGRKSSAAFVSAEGTAINAEAGPMDGTKDGSVNDKPLVFVGLGLESDYKDLDLSGKVALIQRGEISFGDKVKGAMDANADAAIIFNNVDGALAGTLGGSMDIVALSLSKAEGEALVQALALNEEGVGTKEILASLSVEASDFGPQQGTSMATPHVAGVAALVRAANPKLDAVKVKSILRETALAAPMDNSDNKYGNGIVNAFKAVEAASKN